MTFVASLVGIAITHENISVKFLFSRPIILLLFLILVICLLFTNSAIRMTLNAVFF